MKSLKTLKHVLGFSVSVIASEHFFSTFLSSPVTVQTLYQDDESRRLVRRNLLYAAGLSIGFGAVISYWLGDLTAIIGAFVMVIIYGIVYLKALEGAL